MTLPTWVSPSFALYAFLVTNSISLHTSSALTSSLPSLILFISCRKLSICSKMAFSQLVCSLCLHNHVFPDAPRIHLAGKFRNIFVATIDVATCSNRARLYHKTRSSAQGNCSAKSLAPVMSLIIPCLSILHCPPCLPPVMLSEGGSGWGGGFRWGRGRG